MKTHWLKRLRQDANIGQEELAARLQLAGQDYSRSSVNAWENGYSEPPLKNSKFRQALADALHVDVQTVLKMAGYEIETEHSEYANHVAAIVDRLPEEKQIQLLRIAKTFLEE